MAGCRCNIDDSAVCFFDYCSMLTRVLCVLLFFFCRTHDRSAKKLVVRWVLGTDGCTLFDILGEVLGNDRGTSVDFRGCCHGLPWKSAGFHGKGHGSWRFHGKCHVCGHGTCRGSVRGKLRGTNHGNPRKSAAIATAISADVKPQQFPRPSAAILRYTAIATEVHGNCHRIPRPSEAFELPR